MTDKQRSTRNSWGWIAAVVIGAVAAAPLFLNSGFLNTRGAGESPYLLIRLHQLYAALQSGAFPVRWMPDAAFGLGYPFFSYYAALPYYFAAAFKLFGLSYVASLKIVHLLGFMAAATGMYVWVRATTHSETAGLLSAVAYSFAPYHLVDVYVRGDMLSEFWAMAWLPWILLALYRVAQQPSARRISLVGLSYGALITTHNISALIMSPFIVAYAMVVVLTLRDAKISTRKRLAAMTLGGLVGLALSAWVWLPALHEQDAVQIGAQTTGFFDYSAHFRTNDLVQPQFFFNYDPLSPNSSAFALGLVQAVLIGFGALTVIGRGVRDQQVGREGFIILGLVISIWMVTPLSEVMWKHLPLLSLAQFPWRFLGLVSFFGAAATGILVDLARTELVARWLALGLTVIISLSALARLPLNFISITDADVTVERLWWYEAFTGDIGTTVRYEYLPAAVSPRPYTSDLVLGREPHAKFLDGDGHAERLSADARSQRWRVDAETASQLALPLHYWPGWQARIDGRRVEVQTVEGLGWAQVRVPAGAHIVDLRLEPTPLRRIADLTSLIGLLVIIGLWRPAIPRFNLLKWRLVGGGTLTLFVASMVLHSLPVREKIGPLTADFDRAPFFYHSGETLSLNDGSSLAVDQAASVLAPPPPLDIQSAPMAVELSANNTPGLYFPRLVAGADLLTDNGDTRGAIHLAPEIVTSTANWSPEEISRVDADFGIAQLLGAEAQTESGKLQVRLWWHATDEATQNYMVALRLRDTSGNEWVALDVQAGGAGLYPTSLWRPGEIIPDNYRLSVPPGTPPGEMALNVALYDRRTFEAIGETRIDGLHYDYLTPRTCDIQTIARIDDVLQVDAIRLPELEERAKSLDVEIEWAIMLHPQLDYQLVWQLVANNGTTWEQQTAIVEGSDPMQWEPSSCGASILGRYTLPFPFDTPSGEYALTVVVLDDAGNSLGLPLEVGSVTFQATERTFEMPPVETLLAVDFGELLALKGYEIRLETESLYLDMVWQALADPPIDYKSFVHLYDPATGEIVTQMDSMPRAYTYPTSQWATGEIVSEIVTLELVNVPSGDYKIGTGWYDPETGDRLSASGPGQTTWTDDRVVLDEVISIP